MGSSCATGRLHFEEGVSFVDWKDHSRSVVDISKTMVYFLIQSSEVAYDSEGCVRLSDLMNVKNSILNSRLTPAKKKLLIAVFTNPKSRFQFLYPVYRVSGTNRKQFVMPDIGLRAAQ